MARQRPTRLVMGPCIVEIDRIVIREVQYQLEVNQCRNEELVVKDNFGWVPPYYGRGAPGLVMGPYIVEIDRIAIRDVQYQFEVNLCRNEEIIVKGNFGWVWPMWAGRPRVGNGAMHNVQYQFEVNRCRNEEIIVKGNFGWAWPMWAGRPRINCIVIRKVQYQFKTILSGRGLCGHGLCGRGDPGLVMGPCIAEIDRIDIREVQYQFEVNRCRNKEIIVKGNFGWAWRLEIGPCIAEIDRIVIREVQYQFEVNQCNFGWAWPMWPGRPRIDRIVIRVAQYQFEENRCRNEEVNEQVARTDGQTHITTISSLFLRKKWG
ncbi:hypothetical protein DPMN_092602 [Dreissena polymorpha]|uniref:Uncharacterized protein n=1 Tax=Dreissena polymorpha TaxID=45954 RepID=A0A9D4L492_DREPO|nr:hypothetical protein DPMN_092602 [Dreissena polymorpha]